MADDRKPDSVYGVGHEPDPRFSLANERTALSWMRTALALVAGGVAIVSLSSLSTLPAWSALVGAAADMLVSRGVGPLGVTASEVIDAARALLNEATREPAQR